MQSEQGTLCPDIEPICRLGTLKSEHTDSIYDISRHVRASSTCCGVSCMSAFCRQAFDTRRSRELVYAYTGERGMAAFVVAAGITQLVHKSPSFDHVSQRSMLHQ